MMQNSSQIDAKSPPKFHCGGIVLCGGQSRRMGRSKAWLPIGSETCLQRVVRTLSEVLSPILVVAAPHQDLPPLPPGTLTIHDQREGLGPLAGIAAGLEHLSPIVDRAYVSSCDAPLLKSAVITHIVNQLGTSDAAVVREADFYHPLAGIYRTSLATAAWQLIEQNQRRAQTFIESTQHRDIPVDELRKIDPQLLSLENMNSPEDYHRLLALAD